MLWYYFDDSGRKFGPFSDDQARKVLAGENPGHSVNRPNRKVISINGCEYGMIWLEPGAFMRNGPVPDIDDVDFDKADYDAKYKVTISRGFWLLETPVTQAMWSNVMGTRPSHFQGDDLPVEHVSWLDCKSFIEKLNQLAPTEWSFRLPTEAQWEYACGPDSFQMKADDYWHQENSGGTTHPVKSKLPNAQGLYDMLGNVWEWCEDWYDEYPKGHLVDPQGPDSGSQRVARGGSWNSIPNCYPTERSGDDPAGCSYALGFRIASSTPER